MGLFFSLTVFSQINNSTSISGFVFDARTGDPLPYVSVILDATTVGTVTNKDGEYSISTTATSYKIIYSFVGYETESRIIAPGKVQTINIELKPSTIALNEVEVKPVKMPYSNKNNPAVDLINQVIDHKAGNRMENLDSYQYNKYEKVIFSLSNLKDDFRQPKVFNKFQFLLENVDTSRLDGKKNIPMYIKETQSDYYYRRNPKAEKEIITAEKTIKLDEYIDNKGLMANIKYLYQDIDIYANDIFFLSNKFLSPVSSTAPIFYRYFIVDTSMVDNSNCIQLFFEPRNKADFLFHGFLFITADSSYAIKKIDMSFNKKINIDWVNDVRIVQNFDKVEGKAWILTNDNISVDFGASPKSIGLYGQKQTWYSNYLVNDPIPDSVFKGLDKVSDINPLADESSYWDSTRIAPLTRSQEDLYTIIDSVKTIPAFKRRMDLLMLLTTNFLDLGKVEIGSVVSFYSFNTVEGSRVRFGGRTTEDFSKWIYLDSYLAYGFKDERYKYKIGASYSLNGESIYKFPVKSVKLSYQYETQTPGQVLQMSTQDNLFLSFKRGVDDKILYNRTLNFEYLNEFQNHFSFALGVNYGEQEAGGNLFFTRNELSPFSNEFPFLKNSEIYTNLRYAPKEEFYQGKLYRSPISSKYPKMALYASIGSRNFYNDYDYQKLRFSISKRFYFSIVGYTDVLAEAGKIFGRVPYPYLFIPTANQTYSYQRNSYNMMNFLEFVNDQYVSLNIDHSFNGFFFNKIPLLKKLKLREVATVKMLYGGLSQSNNPLSNPDLLRFPVNLDGNPATFSMGQTPYIEGSVGVSNILRVLRVDLIKRFTYLDNPNVSSIGVRIQVRFDI